MLRRIFISFAALLVKVTTLRERDEVKRVSRGYVRAHPRLYTLLQALEARKKRTSREVDAHELLWRDAPHLDEVRDPGREDRRLAAARPRMYRESALCARSDGLALLRVEFREVDGRRDLVEREGRLLERGRRLGVCCRASRRGVWQVLGVAQVVGRLHGGGGRG